jgi:DNA-binding CsgD family transcriptional regulator
MGRLAEAADDARRSLAVARAIGYRTGEINALGDLSFAAVASDDLAGAVQFARQAAQITSGVPGESVRWCSYVLTEALTAAGDMDAADDVCAVALARSRDTGDVAIQLSLLPHMVMVDLHMGRVRDAAAHMREGLQIAVRTGAWGALLDCLDCCGSLCAATGRQAEAVTVWAALAALSRQGGWADPPAWARRREESWRAVRQALRADQICAAEDRGGAMSMATAAEYALMVGAPSSPQAPPTGLPKLSAREQELVRLVARGSSDAQIAAQLYISVHTVGSHLDRIRDKTGCRRRADLTRLALSTGLV